MAYKRLSHIRNTDAILERLTPVVLRLVPPASTEVAVQFIVTPEGGNLYVVEGDFRVNRNTDFGATDKAAQLGLFDAFAKVLPPGVAKFHWQVRLVVREGGEYVDYGNEGTLDLGKSKRGG